MQILYISKLKGETFMTKAFLRKGILNITSTMDMLELEQMLEAAQNYRENILMDIQLLTEDAERCGYGEDKDQLDYNISWIKDRLARVNRQIEKIEETINLYVESCTILYQNARKAPMNLKRENIELQKKYDNSLNKLGSKRLKRLCREHHLGDNKLRKDRGSKIFKTRTLLRQHKERKESILA